MQRRGVPFRSGSRLGSRRRKPADPQAILVKRARERHAERLRERDPGAWGVSAEILALPTSKDVTARIGERKRIIHAKRSNAFERLDQARRFDEAGNLTGGISEAQHRASERYIKDWSERFGVDTALDAPGPVDHQNDGQGRVQRMIDAGRRIDETHARIGPIAARLLTTIAESMVVAGEIRVWQVLVKAATGETEAHAQGAMVRMACEALKIAYGQIDGVLPAEDEVSRPTPVRVWFDAS
jgi:hypothetical protein